MAVIKAFATLRGLGNDILCDLCGLVVYYHLNHTWELIIHNK